MPRKTKPKAGTPLPDDKWSLRDEYDGVFPIDTWDGEESIEVCRVSNQDGNGKARAALIVRAVNLHARLMRFLKKVDDSGRLEDSGFSGPLTDELSALRAAGEEI